MEEREQRKKRIKEELEKKGLKLKQDLMLKDVSGLLECIVEDEQGKKFNLEISGGMGLENCTFTLLASDNPEDEIGGVKSSRLADIPNITELPEAVETERLKTDSGYIPAKREIEEEEEPALRPGNLEMPKVEQASGIGLTISRTQQKKKQPGKGRRPRNLFRSLKNLRAKLRETAPRAQTTAQATTQQPAAAQQQQQQQQQPARQQEESIKQQKEERMKRAQAAQQAGLAGAQPGAQKSKKSEGSSIAGKSLKWAAGITGATVGGAVTHVLFFS